MHGAWGILILLMTFAGIPLPRPFGGLEAYLRYLTPFEVGILLLVSSIGAFMTLYWGRKRKITVILGMIPQQFILLWIAFWSIITLISDATDSESGITYRILFSLVYTLILTGYHTRDIRRCIVEAKMRARMPCK